MLYYIYIGNSQTAIDHLSKVTNGMFVTVSGARKAAKIIDGIRERYNTSILYEQTDTEKDCLDITCLHKRFPRVYIILITEGLPAEARKAYLQATADLDAYARAQSSKYTTADLHLTSLAFRCPLDSYGRITTQFGEADPWGIPHRGADFAAPGGTPVYAIADGIVSAAAAVYSYGNCVQISHGTADDGNTYDSLYAHLNSIAVSQGSAVTKGQVIGYVGNTGNVYSTGGGGYHLHLELRVNRARVNPLAYVPQ